MWIEAIFTKEDVERVFTRAMPITIDLDDEGNHVTLNEPRSVELVADRGLRVQCAAKILWTVLGVHVPITLHTVTALLRPRIVAGPHGDALVFGLVIEHADFAGIPSIIDDRLTDRMNAELDAAHLDLSWDFSEMLSGSFPLPPSLSPLDTISLHVAWGKLKVTSEALVLAISFHSEITRHDADAPPVIEPGRAPMPPAVAALDEPLGLSTPTRRGSSRGAELVAVGAALLGAVSIFSAFRLGSRHARRESLESWLRR